MLYELEAARDFAAERCTRDRDRLVYTITACLAMASLAIALHKQIGLFIAVALLFVVVLSIRDLASANGWSAAKDSTNEAIAAFSKWADARPKPSPHVRIDSHTEATKDEVDLGVPPKKPKERIK
jgi:hypothetical protein